MVARMFALKRSAVWFLAAFAIVLGAPVAAQADDPPAPSVTTLATTHITWTTATFHAKVDPNSTVTTGHFVYGTAPDQLTQRTPDVAFITASGEMSMDTEVKQLSVNTKYYVMAVAENDDWIVTGDMVSFSTEAPPSIRAAYVSDITYKSATMHVNVVAGGQPVAVLGTFRSTSGVEMRFGPYLRTADGEVAVPLTGLEAGADYTWTATVRGFGGEATLNGAFRTDPLVAVPSPTVTPALATYGTNVTISGTIPSKPGLVVTLAEQAFPFNGPIGPLNGTVATTDATGAYALVRRAERPVAYGVVAEGVAVPAAGNIAKLKVAPAVTAKVKRAPPPPVRGGRRLPAGDREQGVALPPRRRTCRRRADEQGHIPLPGAGAEARQVRGSRYTRRGHGLREGQERGPEDPTTLR